MEKQFCYFPFSFPIRKIVECPLQGDACAVAAMPKLLITGQASRDRAEKMICHRFRPFTSAVFDFFVGKATWFLSLALFPTTFSDVQILPDWALDECTGNYMRSCFAEKETLFFHHNTYIFRLAVRRFLCFDCLYQYIHFQLQFSNVWKEECKVRW